MAVQAQFPPSNVLLLSRNMQEVNHFPSLQSQPGDAGLFLVQSAPNIMFPTAGDARAPSNQRRFGMEMPTANSLQPQTTQLIDLALLRNRQPPSVVPTGLGLSFGEQEQMQLLLHQQQQQRQQQQQLGIVDNSTPSSSVLVPSEDFMAETRQQREEIDQFLHAQGEYLRHVLAEKQQRHYRVLLGAAESSATRRLREKEAEVEKAAGRQAELEAQVAQLAVKAQQWQAKVKALEAVAASVQAQLQQAQAQAQANASGFPWDRGDDEAAMDGRTGKGVEAGDAESAYVDPGREEMVGPSCKVCRRRAATVVVLPCRHLCACPECDRVAEACPLCFCHRSSSVEVFLS
ncbi:hypothetical protein MLD38_019709 [Melastoma candidum]|uniref:Uncharacterized protein n=1 Tax=Melastoma candidum TaxID=119954 RepID=A0ACB9R1Y2_9MYRT|nr:hypothetical protein MLD38_019709 [Melastoma candidum]